MRDFNVRKAYLSLEKLEDEEKKVIVEKNDCYVTRYFYEGKTNAQGDPLIIIDDQHGIQRRRYYNSRRGI